MPNLKDVFDQIKKDTTKESIGTKQEKTIHQFLKYYLCSDSNCHEIKLGNHIVDIFCNNHVYEIQTQSFDKMRKKLDYLLDLYPVTIVYPIMTNKTIYKVNDEGVITSCRKSPKKISPISIGFELYKIKDYLFNSNLSFKIILIEGDEFQTTRLDKYKRVKNTRIDQYPKNILDIIDINKPSDFSILIPDNLGKFKINDFKKVSKLNGRKLSSCILAFRHLGIIEFVDKDGKAYVYEKK